MAEAGQTDKVYVAGKLNTKFIYRVNFCYVCPVKRKSQY